MNFPNASESHPPKGAYSREKQDLKGIIQAHPEIGNH